MRPPCCPECYAILHHLESSDLAYLCPLCGATVLWCNDSMVFVPLGHGTEPQAPTTHLLV